MQTHAWFERMGACIDKAVEVLMFAARRAQGVLWSRREALQACTTLAESARERWRETRLPAMLELTEVGTVHAWVLQGNVG